MHTFALPTPSLIASLIFSSSLLACTATTEGPEHDGMIESALYCGGVPDANGTTSGADCAIIPNRAMPDLPARQVFEVRRLCKRFSRGDITGHYVSHAGGTVRSIRWTQEIQWPSIDEIAKTGGKISKHGLPLDYFGTYDPAIKTSTNSAIGLANNIEVRWALDSKGAINLTSLSGSIYDLYDCHPVAR